MRDVRIKFAVITEFPAKKSHCSAPHGTASDFSIHGDRFKARRYVFSGNGKIRRLNEAYRHAAADCPSIFPFDVPAPFEISAALFEFVIFFIQNFIEVVN